MTGEVYDRDKEVREAEIAGERALSSLREADKQLGSARNWGCWISSTAIPFPG